MNVISRQDDSALAISDGLSARVLSKLPAFVGYNESFAPQTMFDLNGAPLEPVRVT
jgi:hypothetical protein